MTVKTNAILTWCANNISKYLLVALKSSYRKENIISIVMEVMCQILLYLLICKIYMYVIISVNSGSPATCFGAAQLVTCTLS